MPIEEGTHLLLLMTNQTVRSPRSKCAYRSTDRLGVNSTTATVYITVNAQAPTSIPPPSSTQQLTAKNLTISTNANTPVQITLNGSSPIKGSTLKFSVLTMPLYGNLSKLTYDTVTYTPNAGSQGSGTVDQFGIKEIYLTKPGSEQWFMNMNDPNHDNRTDPQTILTKILMVAGR
jgi:Big-like domain-containing protein